MPKKVFSVIFLVIFLIILITSSSFAFKIEFRDKGSEVKKIQQYLFNLGYDIATDGIYGFQTKEVVKVFQLNNHLIVDGIVGDKTFDLLEKAAKDIKYIVKKDDCLSVIAYRFDSTTKAIKDKNKLKSDKINIGQELLIPKTGIGGGEEDKLYATIYHKVQPGDVLSVLAKKYGSNVQTIKLANKLHNDRIYVGKTIMIPHLQREVNRPFYLAKGSLIWPVLGRISSPYGYRMHPIKHKREFHKGIDIAVPLGTKIRAAASGTIVQSGWVNGFGKTIIIDHGEGVRTLYAHNSRLLVRAGAKVNLGQVISLSGSTGMSTGPHLDFRIFLKGKTVDPLKYLP